MSASTNDRESTLEMLIADFEGIRDLLRQVRNRLSAKVDDLEGPQPAEPSVGGQLTPAPEGKIGRLKIVIEELSEVSNDLDKMASYYDGL